MTEEVVIQPTGNPMSAQAKTWIAAVLTCCAAALVIAAIVAMTRDPVEKALTAYGVRTAAAFEDDGDAAHLVVTHPAIGEVCKLAGSCAAVIAVQYHRCCGTDATPYWNIRVPGADGHKDDPLCGVVGAGNTLEEAANDFVNTVRANLATKAYKH